MHIRQFSGRDYKKCRLTFNVSEFRVFAVKAHEHCTYAGKYPVISNELFEWLIRKETELEIEPCSPEENERHRPTLVLTTSVDPYGRSSKVAVAMSESLLARFEEVCSITQTNPIKLIQTAIDYILSHDIVNRALATDGHA